MGNAWTDHEGNHFRSMGAMAKYWELSPRLVYDRLYKLKWDVKRALTQDRTEQNQSNRTDHTGREFNSVKELCKHYKIGQHQYRELLKAGYTKEQILTKQVRLSRYKACKDHKGKDYISLDAMCEAYNINKYTVITRLKNGKSLEEALTKPIDTTRKKQKCVDHKGKEYESIKELAKAYHISRMALESRLRGNWDLEEALTKPVNKGIRRKILIDHEGNRYNTIGKMAEAWGIGTDALQSRLRRFWSLEDALTTPLGEKRKKRGKNKDKNGKARGNNEDKDGKASKEGSSNIEV